MDYHTLLHRHNVRQRGQKKEPVKQKKTGPVCVGAPATRIEADWFDFNIATLFAVRPTKTSWTNPKFIQKQVDYASFGNHPNLPDNFFTFSRRY